MIDYERLFEDKKHTMTLEELQQLQQSVYQIAIRYDNLKDSKNAYYFYILAERIQTYIKLERR
jgi:hypothetical protein